MKESTEASYPASNHPLALRARGLSIPPLPFLSVPPSLQHGLVSLVHKKNVIRDGTLTHTNVIEGGVRPAEVIYGSEHRCFLDILFIHLNLFNNNPRHPRGEAKCWAVFTLLMHGIYADPLTWIRMWSGAESTKQRDTSNSNNWLQQAPLKTTLLFFLFFLRSVQIMSGKSWKVCSYWLSECLLSI